MLLLIANQNKNSFTYIFCSYFLSGFLVMSMYMYFLCMLYQAPATNWRQPHTPSGGYPLSSRGYPLDIRKISQRSGYYVGYTPCFQNLVSFRGSFAFTLEHYPGGTDLKINLILSKPGRRRLQSLKKEKEKEYTIKKTIRK